MFALFLALEEARELIGSFLGVTFDTISREQILRCRISVAVKSLQRNDQELQQVPHVLLVLNHEINVSSFGLDCNALPAVKWQVFELARLH